MAKQLSKKKNRNRNSDVNFDYSYQRFASASATVSGSSANGNIRGINESRLKQMLQDPAKSASQVAGLSGGMKQINGMYKRIIKYLSSILTYDHLVYPVMENPIAFAEAPEAMQMAFAQTAIYMDRLNPKFNLPIFTEKMFTKGITFQYKLEDSKGVAYQEMPINLCRIAYIEDGVYRFQMDITKISDSAILTYPKEIQSAHASYKNGGSDQLIEGKWYQVSDKGVAFTIDPEVLSQGGVALPPLANAIVDALKIENAKDQMEDTDKLDNSKIIHSKIETDDRGRPVMELPVVLEYHNALKRALPAGSVAITNPFETKGVSLNGTGKDGKFALLDKTVDSLYKGAGVSGQLFADDNSSSQALERSIQVDCQWLYSFVLPMYANYYNYELKKVGKKGGIWKSKFLAISYFNRDEAIKTAKDQLTFGGSRLEYLAYTGMTPLEVANMLIFEQRVLLIDDFMVAKQTSNTLSGDPMAEEAGRPESDNPSDTTVRIKDSE
ncbi:hypothetical protein BCSAG_48780 [Bacillus cereus]|uniref:hypothetical protein n=2 Tax=Bacillus TaxID=1386 RepID=UPI00397F5B15